MIKRLRHDLFHITPASFPRLFLGLIWGASGWYRGWHGKGHVVEGAGHKAKRLVLQCINGVSSNSVEGRTNICQLKDLILTLIGLIFRRVYIFSIKLVFQVTLRSSGTYILYGCYLLRCLYNILYVL